MGTNLKQAKMRPDIVICFNNVEEKIEILFCTTKEFKSLIKGWKEDLSIIDSWKYRNYKTDEQIFKAYHGDEAVWAWIPENL